MMDRKIKNPIKEKAIKIFQGGPKNIKKYFWEMLQRQQLATNWRTHISKQLILETTTALKYPVRPFYHISLRFLDFLEYQNL